ncbi:sigma-54-dependent transcriptional regulator [Sphingomicrobium astaxanthinifaciens]|uniref:sigma-54-dependent transcriptional regulator n=1 Tax=Sphingomicrobium astaxanthinifaciens TaxID=1227949 RepID=UPI001FCCA612|nr:sigma-54 dependent transcriptional regulator [Sphingomicrobium astaxanthinifaciens]MCJ7420505.1 sigma-54 dependent transcriptional regulator [Sphingomicrobium astaxanthinifaciens]
MSATRVLIVEDATSLALGYAGQLEEQGFSVEIAASANEARSILQRAAFDVVLLDLQLPDGDGLELYREHERELARSSVIVITADGSLERAITAMRCGAYDFLVKPVPGQRLATTVRNAAERHRLRREVKAVRAGRHREQFHGFVGRSPVMQAVYRSIENVAGSKASVFITGESGTGKEVAAEALHKAGDRREGPFVPLNCGAIPESLVESELFGHVKGAFTSALDHREGAISAAHGGTLFLDEICEMELKLQVKLLRFLQTGLVQKVGSNKLEPVDVRVVCATNRDPVVEVDAGRFREDLYYRLNVIPIELPPLRERGDDVMLLAKAFLERYAAEEGKRFDGFSEDSDSFLIAHSWPGNVRELQNVIRRAIILQDGGPLELDRVGRARPVPAGRADLPEAGASRAAMNGWGDPLRDAALELLEGRSFAEVEQILIEAAIAKADGNITRAARALNVSPSTIYRKRERWEALDGGGRIAS